MSDSTAETQEQEQLRETVRRRYAAAATAVARDQRTAESGLSVLEPTAVPVREQTDVPVREQTDVPVREQTDVPVRIPAELPMLEDAGCCGASGGVGCGAPVSAGAPAAVSAARAASPITSDLYASEEVADLPTTAVLASLGCGNPTALAELKPGESVLDLGSGGGIDVLLSAKRVGPNGFVFGLDMTDEMLALAERNRAEHGVHNVRFLKGEIEQIPLPNDSVDVVISNCVINLSADKSRVLREAFRVLKPGGRFAVSDVVVQGQLPTAVRQSMELWVGCVAGALEEDTYRRLLDEAGFGQVRVEVTRVYDPQDMSAGACCGSSQTAVGLADFDMTGGRLVSAFIRATKPGR